MANISKINFNGETLDIKDTYAQEHLAHLTSDTAHLTSDIIAIKAMPRLTVSYNQQNESIIFANLTHTS